jgi:Pectate lyase superfamily protein
MSADNRNPKLVITLSGVLHICFAEQEIVGPFIAGDSVPSDLQPEAICQDTIWFRFRTNGRLLGHQEIRVLEDPLGRGARLSSRRSFGRWGLAGLAALLSAHRVEATPYLGTERRSLAAADLVTPAEPGSDAHTMPMIVDVRDFGARGDGSTDDAPAINAAVHAVRDRHKRVGAYPIGCRIVFPAGIYAVESSINMTGLQAVNTVIDGGGSAILGRCAGKPVIDALGSRWLTVRDLTVLGDPASVPDIGIQIGLVSPRVADDHRFEDVKVLGHFARASLYNRAAETTGFNHLLLWNDHPGGYCLIQDGTNHFGVTSSFAKVEVPMDTGLSFNENEFINCDFRHGAGGTPVWLGDTARHAFIRCYAATGGGPSFIVHCGQNSHVMLDVDCHCETDKLRDVFLFTGPSNQLIVRGFSYRDHRCFVRICDSSA